MSSAINLEGDIVGLDLGAARTGVARINTVAAIAEPLSPITMTEDHGSFYEQLARILHDHNACALVVGLPRGLDGQETEQTMWAKQVIDTLKAKFVVPVFPIDEAGTTKQAEQQAQKDQSVDSVAAGILLEDFVAEVKRGHIVNVTI